MKDNTKPRSASKPGKTKSSRSNARAAAAVRPQLEASRGNKSSAMLLVVLALAAGAAGVAGGWFLRGAQSSAEVTPSPDTAASVVSSAESARCTSWAQKVCTGVGDSAEACGQVKAVAKLLPPAACARALDDVSGTVQKAKAARSSCDELVAKACADLGKDTETCKLVTERTAEFPAAQCQTMLDNYEEVIVELRQLEKANAPLSVAEAERIAAGEVPDYGPADAKVTVVEFSDFECPYCGRAAETMGALKKRYGQKVRFVFRQFPLSFHKEAQLAAEASLAAHGQGKFWEFHDKVFANQRELDRESLEKYAKEIGLDLAKFKRALDDRTHESAVKADVKLGGDIGVNGTPSFFVGTQRVTEPSLDAIASEIDAQLAVN